MKFDISNYRTDDDLKTSGVWVDFGGDARMKIASLSGAAFTAAFTKAQKPYADLGQDVPADDQERIMIDLMSRYVLLDWENIFDGDEALPFSQENAKRLLTEIDFVRERVIKEARRIDNFKAKQKEETAGN